MDLIDYRKRRSRRSDPGMDPEDDLVVDELGPRQNAEDRTAPSLPTPASAMTRRRLQLASRLIASGADAASSVARAASATVLLRRLPERLLCRLPTWAAQAVFGGAMTRYDRGGLPSNVAFATEANDLEDVLVAPDLSPLQSPCRRFADG